MSTQVREFWLIENADLNCGENQIWNEAQTWMDKSKLVHVIEKSAYDKRDTEAKHFCRLYNEALDEIVKLKTRLGEDPGDY